MRLHIGWDGYPVLWRRTLCHGLTCEISFSAWKALEALVEHGIGHLEGRGKGGSSIGELEKVLVGDHDESVHILLQLLSPVCRVSEDLVACRGEP